MHAKVRTPLKNAGSRQMQYSLIPCRMYAQWKDRSFSGWAESRGTLLRTEETNPEAQQQAPGAMTGREELPDELPSCLNQTVDVRFLRADTVFWRKF